MADNYIIKPDMWDYYISCTPSYTDNEYGFSVNVFDVGSDMVEILGSASSIIDRDNPYYYDLTSEFFSNKAWNNSVAKSTVFNGDKICHDIMIPSWFIEHVSNIKETEGHYRDIFYNAIKHNVENGNNYAPDDIVSMIAAYVKESDESIDCDYKFMERIVSIAAHEGYIKNNTDGNYKICL